MGRRTIGTLTRLELHVMLSVLHEHRIATRIVERMTDCGVEEHSRRAISTTLWRLQEGGYLTSRLVRSTPGAKKARAYKASSKGQTVVARELKMLDKLAGRLGRGLSAREGGEMTDIAQTLCDHCGTVIPTDEANSCGCGLTLCNDHAPPEFHDCEEEA